MKRIYARFDLVNNDYLLNDYKIINDTKEFRKSQVESLIARKVPIEGKQIESFVDNESDELLLGLLHEDYNNEKSKVKIKILSYNELAEEIKKAYQVMVEQNLEDLKKSWLEYKEND